MGIRSSYVLYAQYGVSFSYYNFYIGLNPHLQIEQKREELIKQSSVFSYAEAVKRSKKKVMENCTPETEDLFKRLFNPEA